jgi:hypothetical protein
MKKEMQRLQGLIEELRRKRSEFHRKANEFKKQYSTTCKGLGIQVCACAIEFHNDLGVHLFINVYVYIVVGGHCCVVCRETM